MNRILLAVVTFSTALGIALPTWAASSINTTQPANGVPYSPAPIRLNFGAAANDINALQSKNIGTSPPSNPSPGAWWLNNSGVTTYQLNIWDGRGNAWVPVASLDTVNNIWIPPVGGGVLPTLLSANTTDLGSVPQASLYISGNNSIQSFGASAPAGTIKFVIFTGAATLVNVPGMLVLPNGADITQVAGDTAVFLSTAQGSWQLISDSRTAAGPVAPRTILTATGNLYVATTGSDASNSCSVALSPCQTIQHACNIAATTYDLAGNQLLINVANGTYASGCNMAGQFVGTATQSANPSIEFPITGVQIVGNPSNPSLAVIADTSSPGFIPAVFSASAGAYYTVSGFTVSSVNGDGFLAQAQSLLQFGNIIFGNCGNAHIAAHANGVAYATANYTIAGNATSHMESLTGGLVQIGRESPLTVTLSGTPAFTQFALANEHSTIVVNAAVVSYTGSATGARFLAQRNSTILTLAGSPTFFPGNQNGALIDFSVYTPLPPIGSFSTVTGLGTGGAAIPDSVFGAYSTFGAIQLNTGSSGTASSGEVIWAMPTHQWRACIPVLGHQFAAGATIQSYQVDEDNFGFFWQNNGTPLTANSSYYVTYSCTGIST